MSLFKTLFMDIETVAIKEFIKDITPHLRKCFEKKFRDKIYEAIDKPTEEERMIVDLDERVEACTQRVWKKEAGFHPEFGKICCIAVGMIGGDRVLRTRSKVGDDEVAILNWFQNVIDTLRARKEITHLCAHNGKGFDYHFIPKRCLINKLKVDELLQIMGKKPWDLTQLIDTQELWGMGVFNARVALDTLAAVFGIPTPKEVMDGSEVYDYFYGHRGPGGHEKIGLYCESGDVRTQAKVYLAITAQEPLNEPADGLIQ